MATKRVYGTLRRLPKFYINRGSGTRNVRTLATTCLNRQTRCYSDQHHPAQEATDRRWQQSLLKPTNASGLQVQDLQLDEDKRHVVVVFSDGRLGRFPYVYLRDTCQCPACWHPDTHSRKSLLAELDLEIRPNEVKVHQDGAGIEVTWSDGHVSPFQSDWLRDRNFIDNEAQARREKVYGEKKQLWGREMKEKLPKFTFDGIMTDDTVLLKWLLTVDELGVTLIQGAPPEIGQVEKIGSRICFLRRTNYGYTFTLKSKRDPSNLGYTNAKLGFHNDLNPYRYVPGVQVLHCVQNSAKGGENQLVDGFNAAAQLQQLRPDAYDVLTNTLVDFCDTNTDDYKFIKIQRHPVIELDIDGKLRGIHYTELRDTHLNIPLHKVEPLYEGMKTLLDIMHDSRNVLEHRLLPVFDNTRIFHGRNAYETEGVGERVLIGGYMDWDEVRSRIRVLKRELCVDD